MHKKRNVSDPRQALQSAIQLQQAGRPKRADALYRSVLKSHPNYFDGLHFYGIFCAQRGNYEKAAKLLRSAVKVDPSSAEALNNLGNTLQALYHYLDAIDCHRQAIEIDSQFPEAYYNLGMAYAATGSHDEAIECYTQAIRLRPGYAEAHNNLGTTLQTASRYADSQKHFEEALALQPAFFKARLNLGNTFGALGRIDDAIDCYQAVLEQQPGLPEALCNMGVVHIARHDFDAARHWFAQALEKAPRHAEAYFQLGILALIESRLDDAISNFNRALKIRPNYLEARKAQAMTLLLVGKFESGWREYEWRIRAPEYARSQLSKVGLDNLKPDFAGKSVAIICEQGLGDSIQFVRYLKVLNDRKANVTLFAPAVLHRLLETFEPKQEITNVQENLDRFDYRIALMSLPHVLGLADPRDAPGPPYISAQADRVDRWRDFLGDGGYKVGISWQGNPKGIVDVGRSVPLKCFEPVGGIPGVRLISLQKNDGVEQIAPVARYLPVETLGEDFDEGPDAFLDTVAVMQNLDLVITSDTAIAHIAGASGCPVWTLLKMGSDWRWGVGHGDTAWYPTMRLYRQEKPGDWDDVLQRVAADISALLKRGAS